MDGGDEKAQVLANLSTLYAEFHEDIKHYYRKNESAVAVPRDHRTEANFHSILEQTDNLCTNVEDGTIAAARERHDRLAVLMRRSLCHAACYGPREQLAELESRLFGYDLIYTLLGFDDVPDVSDCQETIRRMNRLLDDADSLSPDEHEQCVENCDRVRQVVEPLLAEVPTRNAVFFRLGSLLALVVTITTGVAAAVTGVV